MALLGMFLATIIVVVAEDAFDAERIEQGLERGAEAGVVDALSRLGRGGSGALGSE